MTKQNNNLVYTLIEPRKKLHLNFGEIWRYRDLIVLFVKKDFAEIYKQTILGPIWLFLNLLISTVIYTVVFGGIANISTDGVPKILFYMAGNTMWTFFSDAITRTSTTFRQNTDLFSKIYFPRLTKPIAVVFFTGINLFFQLLMFAAIGRIAGGRQRPLSIHILVYCLLEYGLWVSSCFWEAPVLTEPYYWFELLLTVCFPCFIATTKKAVTE